MSKGSVIWYEELFHLAKIRKDFQEVVLDACAKVLRNKPRYETVANQVELPWWFIGALHYADFDCNFQAEFYRGEKIVGLGKKTTHYPRERGPFDFWEDSALDGLKCWGITGSSAPKLLGQLLRTAEVRGGLEYFKNEKLKQRSPYLWACTNLCKPRGLILNDGSYASMMPANNRAGVATIFKQMSEDELIKLP